MSEITDLTYYQRNRDLILNKKKKSKERYSKKKKLLSVMHKKGSYKRKVKRVL